MLSPGIRKVLVLTSNHVGNTIFCTPGIRLLHKHHPEVQLDVAVMSPGAASVFEHNGDVERVIRVWSRWGVRRLARQYDLVVGLHPGKAEQFGAGLGRKLVAVERGPRPTHRADTILEFVRKLTDVPLTDADRRYVLRPGTEELRRIESKLYPSSARPQFVGLHLGTGRTAVHGWKWWYAQRAADPRIWPVGRYVELAGMLRESHPGVRLVITGTWGERFLARRFASEVPDVIDLVGRTSLLELAALMGSLSAFVTPDSGALHVACSTDVPLVGLFGATSPQHTGPYPRRPWRTIVRGSKVEDIPPREVWSVVGEHLARRTAPGSATGMQGHAHDDLPCLHPSG